MKPDKFLIALSVIFSGFAFLQNKGIDDIVQPGAKLEKLADGFLFTEGPTADAKGNVYFTDQPNNRILVWRIEGKLHTFLEPSGRSNGLAFDSRGNLWSCADEKNELWKKNDGDKMNKINTERIEQMIPAVRRNRSRWFECRKLFAV